MVKYLLLNSIKLFKEWVFLVFLILFLVSTMSGVSYLQNKNIFDVSISYVNNVKMPYSVILNFENKVDLKLEYKVEIINDKQNLVVASNKFDCVGECDSKLDLKQVFFDDYTINVETKYKGKYYEKKLHFKLDKPLTKNEIFMKDIFIYNNSQVKINGSLFLDYPSKVFIETYPLKNNTLRKKKEILCKKNICNFDINLNSEIIFGDYQLNVYLPNDVLTKKFRLVNSNLNFNNLNLKTIVQNISRKIKLNISKNIKKLEVIDLFGDKKEVYVGDNSTIILPKGYVGVNSKLRNINYKIKPLINDISILKKNISKKLNSNKVKVETKRGFMRMQPSFRSLILPEDFNKVIFESEEIKNLNGQILNDNVLNSSLKNENIRKIVPGLYKQEKIIRYTDGSEEVEENYFAYGLISINTKKPLYHKNEKVEILIVVLDKYGYLVDDANISLIVTDPLGMNSSFSTKYMSIEKTDKLGVYKVDLFSNEIGEYKLYVQTELNDMVVDINSYFNVVNNYDFDIIRDVPATIDPWEGPFNNSFEITPLNNYSGIYSFEEVFSSDFDIINTDADEIIKNGDSIYLKWNNLKGISDIYYSAQVPLVSPYLYYLGKAKINYFNEFGNSNFFYENRSWQFAIDPAAKVCGFQSPCICGAACSGGSEPGDGTIDSCSDGNTDYEYVNDIRVTKTSGDYFGIGDTVEVCVDFVCETNEDITIGYKDASNSWDNGDIIWNQNGCDNDGVTETHCKSISLSNYVGKHHIRGKIKYNGNSGRICEDSGTWRDHDDLEFEVLDKITPSIISWNLNNGTNSGNNLNVVRGNMINSTTLWNIPLQKAQITHNGNNSYIDFDVDDYSNNISFINFNTSNLDLFNHRGFINLSKTDAWDKYFNLHGVSSVSKNFNILGTAKVIQSSLNPSAGYSPTSTTMKCQIGDLNVDDLYNNVKVDYYKNGLFLGSNLTNLTGWSEFSFVESTIGKYNITCNVSTNLSNYILSSNFSSITRSLRVANSGSDITSPIISDIVVTPLTFSVGGVTKISVNVTDNIKVDNVRIYILKPDLVSVDFPMVLSSNNIYNYTFTDTLLDGIYEYYIYAEDNSTNYAYSSNKFFEVLGVRTFIGIKSTQKLFKLGQSLNLTDFIKVSDLDITNYNEIGDIDNILYTFDSGTEGWTHGGTQDEWERGVPSDSDLNTCDSGNCWTTDRNNNYNNNADNWIQSPLIDMTGRSNAKVSIWREISFPDANDKIYFESYDGSIWNILYQDTIGATNQEPVINTFYPSEIEGVSNARFRFRMTSDNSGNDEGFTFDTINLTFTPRVNWIKSWNYLTSSFGSDEDKITAIKIGINITNYNSSGSDLAGTKSPDIEFQVYNGTDYSSSFYCNLDSSKSYPYYCDIVIKNIPEYINSWNSSSNRRIRFRAINLDHNDSISWTDIHREYITPSIIENNGIGSMTAYLLEQFKNSTGGIVSTLNFNSISVNPGESKQLSDYWTYSIPWDFQLGFYSAYVALTDADGNVLKNEDDGSYINDSYGFEIKSLIINPIVPKKDKVYNETLILNITLDTSSYGSGGSCLWYSPVVGVNISMTQVTSTNYIYPLQNITDDNYNITFYCNDSDDYWVNTGVINFNISQSPRINFISPSDINNSYVDRDWTLINLSIDDSSFNSSWIIFNGINYTPNCYFSGGITHICSINLSGYKNGMYQYKACAKDNFNNSICSGLYNININKTLPIITILSPLNNSKISILDLVFGNISLDIESININKIWAEINTNGTKYYLTNYSNFNWTYNWSLKTGRYNIQFFGNDSLGNNFSSLINNFIIIPDKNIKIEKEIIPIGDKNYEIKLNITNYGSWENYSLYDYIDKDFKYYDFNLIYDGNLLVNGPNYFGNETKWDIIFPSLTSTIISYKINGTYDFNLLNNYIIGID